MRANDLDPGRLRRLAGLKAPEGAAVLSLYVDLDPMTFGTPPARRSEVSSLTDDLGRHLREADLPHDARVAARQDLERARDALNDTVVDANGAQGLALFVCGRAGLFELVRLPRPVDMRAVVDDSPWIEPLVRIGRTEALAVALVDRRALRLLYGGRDSLEELPDEVGPLRRTPEESGMAAQSHNRPTDNEALEHFKRLGHVLLGLQKRRGFDCLLIAAPEELRGEICGQLHPYVRERLSGWLDVPVDYASIGDVARAASDALDAQRTKREDETLDRLRERLGRGERAAGGLADVLAALNERRVETLLYDAGLRAAGRVCPACGFLSGDAAICPVDGTATEARENIVENAAETAVLQSADVLVLEDRPDLGPHGGIAAVLRF
jgi:hypothetical protein